MEFPFKQMIYFTLLLAIVEIQCEEIQLDFDEIFKGRDCIQGKISTDNMGEMFIETSDNRLLIPKSKDEMEMFLSSTGLISKPPQKESSLLRLLNDLCTHNEISYNFELVKEEGMPHLKKFTILLTMGEEKFLGIDGSIKKAKYAAAKEAIAKTNYKQPKHIELRKPPMMTPVMELNNIATKLGIKLEFKNELGHLIQEEGFLRDTNYYSLDSDSKDYWEKLNASILSDYKKLQSNGSLANNHGPFVVILQVGQNSYTGNGVSIQAAKHDAASKALEFLRLLSDNDGEACSRLGITCDKLNLKNSITILHEIATRDRKALHFNVIEESGKPHDRLFTCECSYDGLPATLGIGNNKKDAKKSAAKKMLQQLEESGTASVLQVSSTTSNSPKKKNRKKKLVRPGAFSEAAKSIMGTASSIYNKFAYKSDEAESDSSKSDLDEDDKQSSSNSQKLSYKNELLSLCNQIGINVHFSTFMNNNKFNTIISLGTDLSHICHEIGAGDIRVTEENASFKALRFIKTVGLANVLIPSKIEKVEILDPSIGGYDKPFDSTADS